MTKVQHTPGPWTAGRPDMGTLVDGVTSKWIYAGDQYVAVASGRIDGDWSEVMANAHLIEAAPDLLAALEDLLRAAGGYIEGSSDMADAILDRSIAAIAKARGEAA